ncbi:hypothetical protein F2P81_024093 [Scophthalmus maximus]|uniref:Uncharacterized protein n=1 Tax=Scophthalmus maximus TaxID=52904 RepID=A0A6A4RNM9_SCOMX|nr:hypothetical protein F2P81_024093 [Scophthalmus maximus]
MDLQTSIECVNNADGYPGVVVYDNETLPISSHHGAAQAVGHGDGPGPHSSVVVFQSARDEDNEDSTTLWASPQTFRDSNGSLEDEVDEDGQL